MITQFFTIGLLVLLSAMLPGPDFAIVTKNTISHSRRAGLFTTLGISSACLIHITYCILGLAIVISNSILLFNAIKYIGAIYLIYLGVSSLLAKQTHLKTENKSHAKKAMSDSAAFRQGFFCNIFNPKATLFFLALFTVIIKPNTPINWQITYAIEIFIIVTIWFSCLSLLLSHKKIMHLLDKAEMYIAKSLGIFLILFGVVLALAKQ